MFRFPHSLFPNSRGSGVSPARCGIRGWRSREFRRSQATPRTQSAASVLFARVMPQDCLVECVFPGDISPFLVYPLFLNPSLTKGRGRGNPLMLGEIILRKRWRCPHQGEIASVSRYPTKLPLQKFLHPALTAAGLIAAHVAPMLTKLLELKYEKGMHPITPLFPLSVRTELYSCSAYAYVNALFCRFFQALWEEFPLLRWLHEIVMAKRTMDCESFQNFSEQKELEKDALMKEMLAKGKKICFSKRNNDVVSKQERRELDAIFSHPVTQFFPLVVLPCLLHYQEMPQTIFKRACQGDMDAICQLIRLDQSVHAIPEIAEHIDALFLSDPVHYRATIGKAMYEGLQPLALEKVKKRIGGFLIFGSGKAKKLCETYLPSGVRFFFDAVRCKSFHCVKNADRNLPEKLNSLGRALREESDGWARCAQRFAEDMQERDPEPFHQIASAYRARLALEES